MSWALRGAAHDVTAVVEMQTRADDDIVLGLARAERRMLLTEDKDFGQLVFADRQATGGVMLLRFPAKRRGTLVKAVLDLVAQRGEQLVGRFVVVQPGRIRLGRRPDK